MSRYKAVLSVQEAGCEAFYEYARSAVDVIPCIKGGGCKSIVQAFDYFPDSPRLIWKACNAVNEMSLHHHVGVSSATSFFLNFPYFYTFYCVTNTFVRVCLLLC